MSRKDSDPETSMESILRENKVLDQRNRSIQLLPTVEEEILNTEGIEVTGSQLAKNFDRFQTDPLIEIRDGEVFVFKGESIVAHWYSEAAVLADIRAAEILDNRLSTWRNWDLQRRARALELIRAGLTECPDCGGRVVMKTDRIGMSCTREVHAVICESCEEALLVTQ